MNWERSIRQAARRRRSTRSEARRGWDGLGFLPDADSPVLGVAGVEQRTFTTRIALEQFFQLDQVTLDDIAGREAAGFDLIEDENMFDDGCPLNKYPETRLRIYRFRPAR